MKVKTKQKADIRYKIKTQLNQNTCHYIKWNITEDLSLRYYYSFDDQQERQHNFFLKSHNSKTYELVTQPHIIYQLQSFDNNPTEILGRRLPGGEYKKIKFQHGIIIGIDTE